jgi:hypothetical protein
MSYYVNTESGCGSGRFLTAEAKIVRDAKIPAGCKMVKLAYGGHHVSDGDGREMCLPDLTEEGRSKVALRLAKLEGIENMRSVVGGVAGYDVANPCYDRAVEALGPIEFDRDDVEWDT